MGIVGKLVVGVLSVSAVVWGVNEKRLAGAAKPAPTRMTCKELGEKGAADNAHVVMTDFLLTPSYVSETKKRKKDWSKLWVPAVPVDGAYAKALVEATPEDAAKLPMPRPVSVIVVSTSAKNEKDLEALNDKDELQGMVVNVIETLKGEEKKLLEAQYGDVSRAQIFHVGRKPANALLGWGAIVGGIAVALGVIYSFVRRKPAPPMPEGGGFPGGVPTPRPDKPRRDAPYGGPGNPGGPTGT